MTTGGKMLLRIIIIITIYLFLFACSTSVDSESDAPADHSINKDGAMHKSGLNNPEENCVSCHGSDLRGGETAPSCYGCHGKEW